MTKQERFDELLEDPTEYCCYCGNVRSGVGCCGENHFETFAEMDMKRQEEFMDCEDYE
jgi:hypothetical protein